MQTWLLRPSLSLPVINAWLNAVVCFISPENLIFASVMHNHLKGIKNVLQILGLLKMGRAKLSDWQGLVKVWYFNVSLEPINTFTLSSHSTQQCFETIWLSYIGQPMWILLNRSVHHPANRTYDLSCIQLISTLDITSFREAGTKINEIVGIVWSKSSNTELKHWLKVDWEESANVGWVCIWPHIDEELDNRKHVYHSIDSILVGHVHEAPYVGTDASSFPVYRCRTNLQKDAHRLCFIFKCCLLSPTG